LYFDDRRNPSLQFIPKTELILVMGTSLNIEEMLDYIKKLYKGKRIQRKRKRNKDVYTMYIKNIQSNGCDALF